MTKREYLLICLMEECAEVQQIASKCLRFGFSNYHPDDADKTPNYQQLRRELYDLDAIRAMLETVTRLNFTPSEARQTLVPKISKVSHYMDVSRDCGILEEQEK